MTIERAKGELFSHLKIDEWFWLNNPQVRRWTDMSIRGIEIDKLPEALEAGKNAILASNYPQSIPETVRALIKLACRLEGDNFRLRAIGREEVIKEAKLLLVALGIPQIVIPAVKGDNGRYSLTGKNFRRILTHLTEEPGIVVWLSPTGNQEGNGLILKHAREGIGLFSYLTKTPVVPLGLVTTEKMGRGQIAEVRFGNLIDPPSDRIDFVDYTKLVMRQIAVLLPLDQRGPDLKSL